MTNLKLIVSNIIGEDVDGFSRVTVGNDLFNAIRGMRPSIAFKDVNDPETGERVRIFEIEGCNLYASYDRSTSKTMFLMNTKEAHDHFIPLAQQLADGPKTPFKLSDFDRTVVKQDPVVPASTPETAEVTA